ncbi:hypothetical protein Bca4012_099078 [Brassica carinata]
MFPEWDGDVEDPAADNIIKVMFNDPGWKWTMDCWQVTGTHKVVKMEVSPVKTEVSPVKSESVDISDAMSDGFGTCLWEIKLLGDRMGAVEKKVGITKKGSSSDDLQLTKPVHEPGVIYKHIVNSKLQSESLNGAKAGQKEAKKPSVTTEPSSSTELCLVKSTDDLPSDEPSVLILDKQVPTASDLLLEKARRQTKKETAMVNLREKSERERKLAPTQQTPFKGNSTAKQIIPNKKVDRGYDPFAPYDKKKSKELTEWLEEDPCPSRFYQVLRTPLEWLTDHQMDAFINLLRRRYQDHPQHFRSERMCFLDHIFSRQWRASYPDFKSDKGDANGLGRRLPVPRCRAGDCGPFTLKYIECHALGMEFPKALCPRNGKTIREKMAVDIFQELSMCHEWENQDNDENLGTYE